MVDPATPQLDWFWRSQRGSRDRCRHRCAFWFLWQVNLADTTQGLDANSDSGVGGVPATFVDRVTNDTTPTFYGRAEADAIVRVYAETNGVAGLQSSARALTCSLA